MTDIELFNRAVAAACSRRHWRALADQGGSARFTRRQCLRQAGQHEAHIVNLSIKAEQRALVQHRAGA